MPYHELKKSFSTFQNFFRYSLQNKGDQLTVSKKETGRKLLELSVELNLKKGIDPQIRIGENTRFRYDYYTKGAMLEYGFNF
ncbi:MAG: hypothetical protein R3A13_11195 [Bdellovibrionota bacterium]